MHEHAVDQAPPEALIECVRMRADCPAINKATHQFSPTSNRGL